MSVLYLAFDTSDRQGRVQKLQKSGAHVVVSEPRWPGFFELAKREKPYAIAIDFSASPLHSTATAEYLSKARETKDVALFLLRVPHDKLEGIKRNLPQAAVVSESELTARVTQMEEEAAARARQKKEAAAAAKKAARAAARAASSPEKAKAAPPAKGKPAPKPKAAAPTKKKAAAKKPAPSKARPKKKK
jgi:hypothetical protein